MPGETPVPVSGKVLDADDLAALVDSSLDGWLTAGRFTQEFERKLARYVGARGVGVRQQRLERQPASPCRP